MAEVSPSQRRERFPIRLGAIDIGSNAIRFLGAEFDDSHAMVPLDSQRRPVRLGHDVFLTGMLTPKAVQDAVAALQRFGERMRKLHIDHYRAVATSAVRDSRNGPELVQRAHAEAGIAIDVITGAEEARLVHMAVRNRVRLGHQKWLIADLGGGSVEVSVVDENRVYRTESHEMGSVRLLEELTVAGEEPARFRRRLEEYIAPLRDSRLLRARVAGFIATGGNIETLARLVHATVDERAVATLPVAKLRAIIERLAALSYRERVSQLNLREDRADVILPAAMVYERLAMLAGADSVLVPGVGVKDGVLWDLVDQANQAVGRRPKANANDENGGEAGAPARSGRGR